MTFGRFLWSELTDLSGRPVPEVPAAWRVVSIGLLVLRAIGYLLLISPLLWGFVLR